MSSETQSQPHTGAHSHHVTPISTLFWTYCLLMAFMVLTIVAAQLPNWFPDNPLVIRFQGAWVLTNLIALSIAAYKGYHVVRTFMGVKYTTKVIKLFAIGGFVWFLLLFILFIDYSSRLWEPVKGWEDVPSTSFPRQRDTDGGVPYPVFTPQAGEHAEGGH